MNSSVTGFYKTPWQPLQGFTALLDNCLAYPTLKKILPNLTNMFHDLNEKVRVATVDLLLKVNELRDLKVSNVQRLNVHHVSFEENTFFHVIILVIISYNRLINYNKYDTGWWDYRPAFKFWQIVPMEHLLARLEEDGLPVVKKLVKLLTDTYAPPTSSLPSQMNRCIKLFSANRTAARKFYFQLAHSLDVNYGCGWNFVYFGDCWWILLLIDY